MLDTNSFGQASEHPATHTTQLISCPQNVGGHLQWEDNSRKNAGL